MNAFIEHHQPAIRFDYACFDRILLNGVIQVLQNPACVVGFLKEKRQADRVTPAYFRAISTDYHHFVQAMEGGLDSFHSAFLHRFTVGDDPFTLRVARGSGSLQGLLDVDHSTILTGSVAVSVPLIDPSNPYYWWYLFLNYYYGVPLPTYTDTLDYTASPMLDLIGPDGTVLATSHGNEP